MSWKKGSGLEFIARRMNVALIFRALKHKKNKYGVWVTPTEYYLLEEIEIGTYGAMNKQKRICSKAEFDLDVLSGHLGYSGKAKIWRLLKSVHEKKIITREKTSIKRFEILGLNEEFFGQILIDTEHAKEQKRNHLRLVDNSPEPVDNLEEQRTIRESNANDSCVNHERIVSEERTNRSRTEDQIPEIKEEKTPLDVLDNLNILEDKNEESFTLLGTETEAQRAAKAKAHIRKKYTNGVMGLVKSL